MHETYLLSPAAVRVIAWRRRIVALIRVCCGCLCALDAGYRWLAMGQMEQAGQNTEVFLQGIHERSLLASGWLFSWLVDGHVQLFTICIAATETVVAGCLLCGALTNLACGLGLCLLLLGSTATGVLAAYFGSAYFDPGIACVLALTFLGLALGHAGQAYGLDSRFADKLGRWSFLASANRITNNTRANHILSGVATIPCGCRPSLSRSGPPMTTTRDDRDAGQNHEIETSDESLVAPAPRERRRVLFL